jgi:spermidine/putrescine transport system substrate-binding protein
MIQRMINEGMLEELNFANIPNFQYIAPEFRNQYYDPDNLYSVPYTYGMVGIIYNTKMVDEADIGSWDLLWNEKYAGKILQFNNARDAFGTAMYYQRIDVNTKDRAQWEIALNLLKQQKPIVQGYVMDEVFNKMKGESAAIAPYYAGDYLTMYDSNDALAFYYPEEGTNVFVDAMCIPKGSRNKEVAEVYINFMLSEEIAVANAEYIGYASPNLLVRENEDYIAYMEDWHEDAMTILYPDTASVPTQYYHMLDATTQSMANELWEQLKIESSVGGTIHTIALVIVVLCTAFFLWRFILKKYRMSHY